MQYREARRILLHALPWLTVTLTTLSSYLHAADPALGNVKKYALLVGCTSYPNNPGLRQLDGPANDVPLWAKLLTDSKGFAFPVENVAQLVGWPDHPKKRPTYANIVRGFEDLISKAAPDTQIVIVLCGHGTRVPIPDTQKEPLDPKNPAPDGMNGVFLAADVKEWTDEGGNGIKDIQIGDWLDRMRDKGASVWIVLDCCHAGAMTRGDSNVEASRFVAPEALGISKETLEKAATRAREAVKKAEAKGGKPREAFAQRIKPRKGAKGSVVAFYACLPFEEEKELPLPEGRENIPENRYGLMSYHLVQCLLERRSPISYGELHHRLACQYRASRGTREPTPYVEGDIEREVLGLRSWPYRPDILLYKKDGKMRLSAGGLVGITAGSILGVHPPHGDPRNEKEELGHVRVDRTSAMIADVRPCGYGDKPAVAPNKLPDGARCEIVSRDFGDMRVRLCVEAAPALKRLWDKLTQEVREMTTIIPNEAEAEWVLRTVAPNDAKKEFGIDGLKSDHVLLLQSQGRTRDREEERAAAQRPRITGQPMLRKVYGMYPADTKALIGGLERDLPKIFKWQNVWRVASGIQGQASGETHGLKFEVAKLKDENDRTGGELLRGGILRSGQEMEFRLRNEGNQNLWATLLYLDANLKIEIFASKVIERGKAWDPIRGTLTVNGNSFGREGMLVFAIPTAVQREEPNFRFLEQEPLQVAAKTSRSADETPRSPFGKLLGAAAFAKGTRDLVQRVPTTPAILSQSWVLVRE
jgi:hypothetical protein